MGYDDPALQLQGARAAARASVPPKGKVSLARVGAVQQLVTVVRRANAAVNARGGGGGGGGGVDEAAQQEQEREEPLALAASLTALLNLSVNPRLQVSICKEGLRPLLRAARRRGGVGAAARLAQAVLSNISRRGCVHPPHHFGPSVRSLVHSSVHSSVHSLVHS